MRTSEPNGEIPRHVRPRGNIITVPNQENGGRKKPFVEKLPACGPEGRCAVFRCRTVTLGGRRTRIGRMGQGLRPCQRRRLIIEGRRCHLQPRFSFAPRFQHETSEADCALRRDPKPSRPDHRTTHVPTAVEESGRRFVLDPLAGGRVQQASGRRRPFCGQRVEGTIWGFPEACFRREDWCFGGKCRNACRTRRGHLCPALCFAYGYGCRRPAAESRQPGGSSDNAAK